MLCLRDISHSEKKGKAQQQQQQKFLVFGVIEKVNNEL